MKKLSVLLLLFPFFAIGCGGGCASDINTNNPSVLKEAVETEANQKKLATATPPPSFEHSLEREMLVKRLKTLNVQNKLMYIYCLGLNGNVVLYSPVQGKVSSLNSLLTTPEQIIRYKDAGTWRYEKMPSPDFDGSYGKNPEGVFWFSPDGGYHEWSGLYYLSDRPSKINTPISLTATVDLEKKGK